MTDDEHKARHILLHQAFDELVADFLTHNRSRHLTSTNLMVLMEWSHSQTLRPTPEPESIPREAVQ